jgi:hypothetical protein
LLTADSRSAELRKITPMGELVRVCMSCEVVMGVEMVGDHEAGLTHGICDPCLAEKYPDDDEADS